MKIRLNMRLEIIVIIIIVSITLVIAQNLVNYQAIASDVRNGVTYTLYSGLFSLQVLVVVMFMGIIAALAKRLRALIFWLCYMWFMMFALALLINGYVIGDQPRLEFALGRHMIDYGTTLSEAQNVSGYFNWPSFWILSGIYSSLTNLTPFEAPPILMISIYVVLGLSLIILTRSVMILVTNHKKASWISTIGLPLALYIINPYKIIHPCPQVYALTLFLLVFSLLLEAEANVQRLAIIVALSSAIVTGHPLTSIVVVGLLIIDTTYLLFYNRHELKAEILFSIVIIILFTIWNLNYENLIRSIIIELLRPELESLPPIASSKIYTIDSFFMFMVIFRYISIVFIVFTTIPLLIKLLMLCRRSGVQKLIIMMFGTITGSILLNFTPGSFLHRILYFSSALLVPLSATSLISLFRNKSITKVAMVTLFLLPLLSHISLLEFLTNNNPTAMITGPYELHADSFIVDNIEVMSIKTIGVSSGSIGFYEAFYNVYMHNLLIPGRALYASPPTSLSLAKKFSQTVYSMDIFISSPRERFILYIITGFHDFSTLDTYLYASFSEVYDNGVFEVFSK